MGFVNNRRTLVLVIILILLLWAITLFLVDKQYRRKYEDYVAYRNEVFDNAIAGVVRSYEGFSNYIFASAIDNDQIKAFLYAANHGDAKVKARMRQELAQQLQKTHQRITEHNFRQFHFQLANGDSFYRFHNPEKYGDNLLDVRESMRIANLEQRYVTGFEEGRTFSGYRFVYPISYQAEHMGSIEISISPQCILEELYALDSNRDLGFILAKNVMEKTVFDDQQSRYKTSFVSDEYVYDIEIAKTNELRQAGLNLQTNEAFLTQLKKLISADLHHKLPVNLALDYNSKTHFIQYRPIIDISGQPIGYFYSYKEDKEIQAFVQAKRLVSSLATVIMLMLILLVAYMNNKQKEILRVAMTDNLTSIYNRHSFYILAKRELARADRTDETLAIALLDIDYFKKVNDTYGHSMGDQVLKIVAKLIKNSIRETDILARYGGEEFIILMPATSASNAYIVAERIRTIIAAYRFEKLGHVTISTGLSARINNEKLDEIINKADEALYEAKQTGRNKSVIS